MISAAHLKIGEPAGSLREDGTRRLTRRVDWNSSGDALRLAGLREEIHPRDVVAFIYPDREYFADSARRDAELHNKVYGPYETDQGLLGIVDMRPAIAAQGLEHTIADPALPDACHPHCECHHQRSASPPPSA